MIQLLKIPVDAGSSQPATGEESEFSDREVKRKVTMTIPHLALP
jgi:hypothetical protein